MTDRIEKKKKNESKKEVHDGRKGTSISQIFQS